MNTTTKNQDSGSARVESDRPSLPAQTGYPEFSICRNGTRTQLITVTKKGRFGDVLANVLTGWEGNIREALNACERGDIAEGIRIFTNKP